MQPIITIFCAFTREWALQQWLKNLETIDHDRALTNLCIIVDGDQWLIANTIKKFAEQHKYRSLHLKVNDNWSPNEVRLAIRRMRVADIKNQSKDLIAKTDGDIIIGLEDDTVFDRLSSFGPLYRPLLEDDDVGFVEGVQIGRWGAKIIGAWQADNAADPKHIETLLPESGIQEISSGGFYGYATRRNLYANHEYYTSSNQPWGPDVNYGLYVRQQGFKCLIDWDSIFGHNIYNEILYPDNPNIRLSKVIYDKDQYTGRWQRTDKELSNL